MVTDDLADHEGGEKVDSALQWALHRTPPAPDAFARMRAAVEAEWQVATGATWTERPEGPSWRWFAIPVAAAGLLAIATWLGLTWQGPEIGAIARVLAPAPEIQGRVSGAGRSVHAGDVVHSPAGVMVVLRGGAMLRIAAKSTIQFAKGGEVRLDEGAVFVDIPPGLAASPLSVLTHEGVVEHLGTAFEVISNPQSVQVRVREGHIRFRGAGADAIVSAGIELRVQGTRFDQRPIDTTGDTWHWVEALAPDYDIEGRSLLSFLERVSRELGRHLKFADTHAREVAERTVLHGSVRSGPPQDALNEVLASTSLQCNLVRDTVWVHSGP